MAIVSPADFLPPTSVPDLSTSGPMALATGQVSPVEEFAAKVSQFIKLMGPVIDFLVQNPEIAPAARNLFNSLANTTKEKTRSAQESKRGAPVGGPALPGLPAPPGLIPPGPSLPIPGPGLFR